MTDPQALIGQVRKALYQLVDGLGEPTLKNLPSRQLKTQAVVTLNQLAAYIAAQEQAVRVKVLKEVKTEYGKQDKTIPHDTLWGLINQKIKEAK